MYIERVCMSLYENPIRTGFTVISVRIELVRTHISASNVIRLNMFLIFLPKIPLYSVRTTTVFSPFRSRLSGAIHLTPKPKRYLSKYVYIVL